MAHVNHQQNSRYELYGAYVASWNLTVIAAPPGGGAADTSPAQLGLS
jgi:hypothetical protein